MFALPKFEWVRMLPEGNDWVRQLPAQIKTCAQQWSLQLESPYADSNVSIVLPATTTDGSPAVLKIQFPVRESEHEAEALKCWNGEGAVRLLAHDPVQHALLDRTLRSRHFAV